MSESRNEVNLIDSLVALVAKFCALLVVVLMPIRPALVAVSVLVVADFITGLWASKKEGKPITSAGLKKTVVKTLAYQSAIVIAFVLETYLLDGMPVIKVVTAMIGLTEGKSFFENMHRITGIDYWSEFLKRLQGDTVKTLPSSKENEEGK